MTLTVACVLRSGGIYTPEWVAKLQRGVERHMSVYHRFVCLSDVDVPCERIPLVTDWPGWWSKVELFREGLFDGPVLYMDLDSVIVGHLDDMFAGPDEFRMVKMWGQRAGDYCSTAMSWHGDFSTLYRDFAAVPEFYRHLYDKELPGGRIGDQAFIEDRLRYWQQPITHWPGLQVASYKDHSRNCPPADARIVAYHGRPKPCDAKDGWTAKAWN